MALCPHCRNALPESQPRYCPNCGGDVERPAEGLRAPPEAPVPPLPATTPLGDRTINGATRPRRGTPWEDRARLGWANALVETTKEVLGRPVTFFRSMDVVGGVGSPLLYAVIVGWAGTVLTSFYFALFQSIADPAALGGDVAAWFRASTPLEVWGSFVVNVVFGPLMQAIVVFVAGGVLHVSLLMVGGARGDFEGTFRVVCYAQAPSVVAILPFCGGWIVVPIWTLVLYVIGLAKVHRIGGGRALLAVLLPLALVCCCCAALGAIFASSLGALAAQVR